MLCLLGLVAFSLINTNFGKTQANSQSLNSEELQPDNKYTRNRHVINLVLDSLDELKVTEGQRIKPGDIISDRKLSRDRLQAKKERLKTSIAKAKLPLNQLKPVPIPKFQTELAALKQAQFNLDMIVQQINNFDKNFHHKDPWHVQIFESEKVQQLADLKRRELEASINVEKAIARIDEAKLNYQKQQYEHSLKVSNYQVAIAKQQEQINNLQIQLDRVNDELEKSTSVYSPYRGKVRKIKIVEQNNRLITAEITLDIRNRDEF